MFEEELVSFPYEDLLHDALDEHRLKRFTRRVAEKKGDLNVECGDS